MAVRISSIKKAVQKSGIKILVHGLSGAGKTVLCCTTGEPTLLISAESGLLSVEDAPDYIKTTEIESMEDLDELYDFLVDDQGETFKWVALDSITEIAERILSYELKQSPDPRKAYGALQEQLMDYLRKFRDLRGYNVVMSCKQQLIQMDDGPSLRAPMMPGTKLWQQIPYIFDEVFALRVEKDESGEDYRIIQTGRDTKYEAKDRSGKLNMFEPPNLKKIAAKIRDGWEEVAKSKKEKVLVEEVEEGEEEYCEHGNIIDNDTKIADCPECEESEAIEEVEN